MIVTKGCKLWHSVHPLENAHKNTKKIYIENKKIYIYIENNKYFALVSFLLVFKSN